jgi:4a-hydroxytetrahydrobiopterin dehydratase
LHTVVIHSRAELSPRRHYGGSHGLPLTPRQFHDAAGVDDWRVLWSVAFAVFRTGDFATGLTLVDEIGRVADAAGHHPDLDLRSGVLEVRLVTRSTGR